MSGSEPKGFEAKLSARIDKAGSHLCVGLDPRPNRIRGDVTDFLMRVVEETADYAAAYKPNIAYFESMGPTGYAILEKLISEIPDDIPMILDAKRSDIPETQKAYAHAYFDLWNVDAVTINPLLGRDSIEPFLNYRDKGIYLLGMTSNSGAQDIMMRSLDGRPFLNIIQEMCEWAGGYPGTAGLVIGLSHASDNLFKNLIDVPLLIPGFGAQQGHIGHLRMTGRKSPWLINVSRSILYPEQGSGIREQAELHAEAIRQAGE